MIADGGSDLTVRWRGPLLAAILVAVTLAFQLVRLRGGEHFDRFALPAFDAHAYIAMAEHPGFFTVAPWGYRILTPALVHWLPVRKSVQGFRLLCLAGLGTGCLLLYFYLRRLGFREGWALLAVAAVGLTRPIVESLDYRFLVEPLTFALEVGFLLTLEIGASTGVLALLAVLGTLSKEPFLLLLPLVFLRGRPHLGWRRALVRTAVVTTPAMLCFLALRLYWVPHLRVPWPVFNLSMVALAGSRIAATWSEWAPSVLLAGLTPLALLGALSRRASSFRTTAAYLFLMALCPPFFNPVTFLPSDIPRLLLYALPGILPLAVLALDRLGPSTPLRSAAIPSDRRFAAVTGWVLTIFAAGAPMLAVDGYRRIDLQGPRDGPYVLALCRETLRTARQLARGETVVFDLGEQRFRWGESDPGELPRMRWFLRQGFGLRPHYGTAEAIWRERRASILVPSFGGQDLDVELSFEAPARERVRATLAHVPLGEWELGPDSGVVRLSIAKTLVLRGDNELFLERDSDLPGPHLLRLVLSPGDGAAIPERDGAHGGRQPR